MGSRGPAPKRSSERRRRNADPVERVAVSGTVTVPEPSEEWHPIALEWYVSLGASGQSQFYESSDWAAAFLVAESMTRLLVSSRFSSELFKGVWSAMNDLMTTEASRRRARVEVERVVGEAAEVTSLDDFKRNLAKGGVG